MTMQTFFGHYWQRASCLHSFWRVAGGRLLPIGLLAFSVAVPRAALAQNPVVLADSLREFSSTTQGENNWHYGYYPDPINRAFQPMDPCSDFGGVWSADCPNASWIIVDAIGGSTGSLSWPVRRWISEVSGEVTISGRLAKGDWDCGDGVMGYIFVDGQQVWSQFVDYFDSVGVWYSITVEVEQGSTVDFAVDPGFNNWCDHVVFTATISMEPLPGDVNGDDIVDDADLLIVLFNFGRSR